MRDTQNQYKKWIKKKEVGWSEIFELFQEEFDKLMQEFRSS